MSTIHLNSAPGDHDTPVNVASGYPLVLPRVPVGSTEVPPNLWARHIQCLRFRSSRQGEALKTDLLISLNEMNLRRGYQMRNDHNYEPAGIQHALGENTSKAEAALMYCVGALKEGEDRCMCCIRHLGPFPHCVRIHNNGFVSACANCHWDGNDDRCSFFEPATNDEQEEMEPTGSQSLLDQAGALIENLNTHDLTMDNIATSFNEISNAHASLNAAMLVRDTPAVLTASRDMISRGGGNPAQGSSGEQGVLKCCSLVSTN